MTKFLGVDYGRRKIGLAIADGPLAEPLKVVRVSPVGGVVSEVARVVEVENVEKVVVGISEGVMGEESKDFSLSLSRELDIPVETFDETLTTQDAQKMAIEAGISRKKRKSLEDAFAATVMLQSYLEKKEHV